MTLMEEDIKELKDWFKTVRDNSLHIHRDNIHMLAYGTCQSVEHHIL